MVNPSGMTNLPYGMFPGYGTMMPEQTTGYFPYQTGGVPGMPSSTQYGAGMMPMGGAPMMHNPSSPMPYPSMGMNPYQNVNPGKMHQQMPPTMKGQYSPYPYSATTPSNMTKAPVTGSTKGMTPTGTNPYMMGTTPGMNNENMAAQSMPWGTPQQAGGYQLGNLHTGPQGYSTPTTPMFPENTVYPGLNETTNPVLPEYGAWPMPNPMGGPGHMGQPY